MRWLCVLPAVVLPMHLAVAKWHPMRTRDQPQKTFDSKVLRSVQDLDHLDITADVRVSRSHIFSVDITVGTPPQEMACLLDTGSADLWIPSKRCKDCDSEHHFHAEKSKTFIPAVMRTPQGMMPVPVQGHDDGGEIVGFLVQDTIGLGSNSFHNQSFVIVEKEHLPEDRSWDAICGLGWHEMTTAGQPLYKTLQRDNELAVFALFPLPSGQTYLVVGEMPHGQYKVETLVMAPAKPMRAHSDRTFWVTDGEVKVNATHIQKAAFLVDTGTPFLLAPLKDYKNFLHSLFTRELFHRYCGIDKEAGHLVVCDCGVTAHVQAEKFSIYIKEREYAIPVAALFKRVPSTDDSDLCLLRLQPNLMTTIDPVALLAGLLGVGAGPPPPGAGGLPHPPFGHGPPDGSDDHFKDKAHAMMPPPMLPPFLFPGGPGKMPPGGEQIEEIVHAREDGSVCTTTLVWDDHHKLLRNGTKCRDPRSHSAASRRLQLMLPGMLPGVSAPPADTWVLGGVFLEKFVVILDYENKRLGFAEPLHSYDFGAPEEAYPGADAHSRERPPQYFGHPHHAIPPQPNPTIPPPPPQPAYRHPYHHDANEADPMLDRAPVLRPNAILQPNVQDSRASAADDGSSFNWGMAIFCIILFSLVFGAWTVVRKASQRKFLRDSEGTADIEENFRGGTGSAYDPEDINAAE